MIDKTHHYFTNRKYVYTHICIKKDGMWMVFEKIKDRPLGKPLAIGGSQGEAIENAVLQHGIKHYMVEVIE